MMGSFFFFFFFRPSSQTTSYYSVGRSYIHLLTGLILRFFFFFFFFLFHFFVFLLYHNIKFSKLATDKEIRTHTLVLTFSWIHFIVMLMKTRLLASSSLSSFVRTRHLLKKKNEKNIAKSA